MSKSNYPKSEHSVVNWKDSSVNHLLYDFPSYSRSFIYWMPADVLLWNRQLTDSLVCRSSFVSCACFVKVKASVCWYICTVDSLWESVMLINTGKFHGRTFSCASDYENLPNFVSKHWKPLTRLGIEVVKNFGLSRRHLSQNLSTKLYLQASRIEIVATDILIVYPVSKKPWWVELTNIHQYYYVYPLKIKLTHLCMK